MKTEDSQKPPAVEGRLDLPVVPLVERLRELNAVFHEDEGRDLNVESVRIAIDFAARHTDPDTVSAGPSGDVCFTWRAGLAMRFLASGATHWAGKLGASRRPYGTGEPDVSLWPCLRHNV